MIQPRLNQLICESCVAKGVETNVFDYNYRGPKRVACELCGIMDVIVQPQREVVHKKTLSLYIPIELSDKIDNKAKKLKIPKCTLVLELILPLLLEHFRED